ncbi:hypothetical protein ABH926_007798 [Catenulispora sp. GP43]|uniref:condensation domain-containing protein n=1 Tax=Catenulispora sp. GP43 TaxID=3156263 RepID=UPI003513AD7D
MRMIEFVDDAIAPGRVLVWSAVGAEPAAGDGAPPSLIQQTYLRQSWAQRAAGAAKPRWWGVAADVAGRFDRDAMAGVFAELVRRHDAFRAMFHVEDGGVEYRQVGADRVEFVAEDLGTPGTGRELAVRLSEIFDRRTDPFTWPQYVFVTVERESDWTVLFSADHVVIDLYSLANVGNELVELYESAVEGREPQLFPGVRYAEFCEAEREALPSPEVLTESVGLWHALAESGDGTLPGFPIDLGDFREQPRVAAYEESVLADAAMTQRFERWCRSHGGSLPSGLAAAVAIASTPAGEPFRTILAVGTRPVGPRSTMGWYVTAAPLSFPVGDDSSGLRATMATAHAAMRTIDRDIPYAVVTDRLPPELGFDDASWLSIVDFRSLPGAERHTEWNLRAVGAPRYVTGGDLWINIVARGLTAHVRYPSSDEARKRVLRFLDTIADIIAGVSGAE